MKSYIITNIKHDEYDARGLSDLFQLYLVKLIEDKYSTPTEYKSDNTIEVDNSKMSFDMRTWKSLRPEVKTLMLEFTKAMSYTAYNVEINVEFVNWDAEFNEGGMITYKMDFDGDMDEDEMSTISTDSLRSKINVLEHMLKDNLVPDNWTVENMLTDELNKLRRELHPDVQTEVKAEETSTKATDVTICRTMNDVIEKMNKLIATVEMLEEKMLNK
nr:MAG TPA: hypothetical protein [Caudoviricetes sp.]